MGALEQFEDSNIANDRYGPFEPELGGMILLMKEILHHLGCIKPCK